MPANDERWVLIFSDGTGQRGVRDEADMPQISGMTVKNTNVFQIYFATEGLPEFEAFYDAGLGAPAEGGNEWSRTLRNLWSKATGWGITANITDCYEALMMRWKPGMKIGLFGFSRGAYTVRCLGGVLATCGLATRMDGAPLPGDETAAAVKRRRAVAEEAVATYKIGKEDKRRAAGQTFAERHASELCVPDVIGVFDTVKALGLPGVMNAVNPWQHEFHDSELASRVHVGLHALSIDENRKTFAPELWDDPDVEALAKGQVIEQVWFPGVHSDVGGGYEDGRLADLALQWMLARAEALVGLRIPLSVSIHDNLLAPSHNERTGFGVLWRPGERAIRGKAVDVDAACADLETRFDRHAPAYRPNPLSRHPRFARFY
ncbi:DUF2235 domain-containing protein [Mesorhizobium sp. CAU 1741]|uniref:DUF2235 domain-containing protein n=1 Tax=Mesorhizobium sp. CAU 1741 TaxID=3140366 RepID=UPI00325A67B6